MENITKKGDKKMNQIINTILSRDIKQLGAAKILLALFSNGKASYSKLRGEVHLWDDAVSRGLSSLIKKKMIIKVGKEYLLNPEIFDIRNQTTTSATQPVGSETGDVVITIKWIR